MLLCGLAVEQLSQAIEERELKQHVAVIRHGPLLIELVKEGLKVLGIRLRHLPLLTPYHLKYLPEFMRYRTSRSVQS